MSAANSSSSSAPTSDPRIIETPWGHIDLMDPKTHNDPWEMYDWLRENAPMYWDPINELWGVSSYDGIVECARQPKVFTSEDGNLPKMPPDPSFINLDGRKHHERRKLIHHYFTPKAVRKMTEEIRVAVDKLLDRVIERGECDFVNEIAKPLPLYLIAQMLGIPDESRDDVIEWMDEFVKGGNGPDHITEEVNEAFVNFGFLHYQLCDERRENPKDDMLSMWVHATIDGVPLDDDELLFDHTLMIIGGGETTRASLGCAVEMLAKQPDDRAWLMDHPEGLKNATEEAIRYVTPFVRMSRTAAVDTTLEGVEVKKGEEVAMLYGPANRDPNVFPNPHAFDIHRSFKKKSLAFGHGHHFCLGAFLARAEVSIGLEQMFARMPDWELAGEPTWVESSFLRGLDSLPIRFTPGTKVY